MSSLVLRRATVLVPGRNLVRLTRKQLVLADLKDVRLFDFEDWNEITSLRSRLGDPNSL